MRDLSETVEELSHELFKLSHLLHDFGQDLKNDPNPTDEGKRSRRRRKAENLADARYYAEAALTAMTTFTVPNDQPVPRALLVN